MSELYLPYFSFSAVAFNEMKNGVADNYSAC